MYAYLAGTNNPASGKTIAVTISKNGAAYGNPSAGATNATEIGNGSYYVDLSTTDTGTQGPLLVYGTEGTIDPIKVPPFLVGPVPVANYDNGSVWFDTILGVAGTTADLNGVRDKPTNLLSSAVTIAIAKKLSQIHAGSGTSDTLVVGDNYRYWGANWTLTLGGVGVNNVTIEGATVSGILTGSGNSFNACVVGTVTLPPCGMTGCILTSTLTVGSAGTYYLDGCTSNSASATLDMGSAVGATTVYISAWSGTLTLKNVKTGDVVYLCGAGQLTLDSTCTGGSLIYDGLQLVSNASSGMSIVSVPSDVNVIQWVYVPQTNGSFVVNINGNLSGSVGSVAGNISGNLLGNVNGNVVGAVALVTGSVGSVTGNVGGNLVGNVLGGVSGSINGSVLGNLGGSVLGSLSGSVGGNVVGSVGSVVGASGLKIQKNQPHTFSFPMLLTGTNTPAGAGLAVTAVRRIDGAAFVACTATPSNTDTYGSSSVAFVAADLNGNNILFRFDAPGCDSTWLSVVTEG